MALSSLTFIAQSRNSQQAPPKRQDASSIVPPDRASTARASRLAAVGIAPTGDPGQGFDIEGDLQANTPNANTTDWVPGAAGAGIGGAREFNGEPCRHGFPERRRKQQIHAASQRAMGNAVERPWRRG